MAKHRTIDQALDMFESWEADALERRQREGERTLEEVLEELERHAGVRLAVLERAGPDSGSRRRNGARPKRLLRRKRRAAR